MSLNKFRSFNYKLARMLGDVNAIQKGRIGKRIGRRIVGNFFARLLGRLFR